MFNSGVILPSQWIPDLESEHLVHTVGVKFPVTHFVILGARLRHTYTMMCDKRGVKDIGYNF